MSDLQGLWDAGIEVGGLYRNMSYTSGQYRQIKLAGGPLTKDAERYATMCDWPLMSPLVDPGFNARMGGIIEHRFAAEYPRHTDTNDLSMAVFLQFGEFKILFPGDLEEAGWRDLLGRPTFRDHLASTTILVASHHGRESGYLEEVFDYCRPRAVVMSDKGIIHETQGMTETYRGHVIANYPDGVYVKNLNRQRHVLTTRNDGHIHFTVGANGFDVETEYG